MKDSSLILKSPSADAIVPETLATVLARISRFGGHTKGPPNKIYPVAQHLVLVCDLIEEEELKLPGLLHDGHEAYSGFGDVTGPAKNYQTKLTVILRALEDKIDRVIAKRFGFRPDLFYKPKVIAADKLALATERKSLMAECNDDWGPLPEPLNRKIVPMSINKARDAFLEKLYTYWSP